MKHHAWLAAFFTFLLASCGPGDDKGTLIEKKDYYACYEYVAPDSSKVMLNIFEDDPLLGELKYDWKEKDKSHGTIKGHINGDTLFAEFAFFSEGVMSKRDVVFLKQGDTYMEGYGKIDTATGLPNLKDHPTLKFDSGIVLRKIICKND